MKHTIKPVIGRPRNPNSKHQRYLTYIAMIEVMGLKFARKKGPKKSI